MELKSTLAFLTELSQNNHKEWFDENRKVYENCKKGFLDLLQQIIEEISTFDHSLTGVDPKKCIFRINRDIRFGKDKTPYKTNFGALLSEHGRKTEGTGYYIHISPGQNFVGGGMYKPQPEVLQKIRQEIDYNPKDLLDVIESQEFKSTFGEIRGEQLKTAPKGYPKDHPLIHLLRYKSYYVMKEYSDSKVVAENFLQDTVDTYKKAFQFNEFLKNATN